ncbi:glycine hydroxymethyltransferase [Povalibacter uvarum]|uniref:Serine hydroxymethyltransferase n=1 Tax=Povalibacter uvarum TaxID=732238 RepID=A0A841HIQ8_9GAMM|nr:serine hydroxymethyltransferase [Povalibacter uvarum]MBB6092042.1 glycine hydroxymethyltransferase [Povalibacter uvarum]
MQSTLELLRSSDPDVHAAIIGEERRQREGLELIPSENYAFPEVYATNGSVFANKYAEGYPGRRYYGGQAYTDRIETLAVERAKQLFRAEHANVQPLSGSPMNQAVYMACLQPGDTVLAMDLSHGGHLTHGAPVSAMGKIFNFVRYKTSPPDGHIDYDHVRSLALDVRPKIVLCGHSSYPRELDYARFRAIADEVGALTMADVSHIGGLIAGGALANPIDAGFDIVTTTTHKSLRGPRGGLILCKSSLAQRIDQAVFPGMQGGPHMNAVAGIAVTLKLAAEPAFKAYAQQVIRNAQRLAAELLQRGCKLITGGTENHLLVIDTIQSFGIDGRVAEAALDVAGLTVNKQVIPDDPRPPLRPSGIRLGTPAMTTRGLGEAEMVLVADFMTRAMRAHEDQKTLEGIHDEVRGLCARFPVPGLE